MSPLAQLLQMRPKPERTAGLRIALANLWKRITELLRSARVQRRVRRMEVVERVTLGNKQSVILVRVDQKEFIVGCCGESVVLLVPPPETPKARARTQQRAKHEALPAPPLPPLPSPVVALEVAAGSSGAAPKLKPQPSATARRRVPSKAKLVKSFAGRSK